MTELNEKLREKVAELEHEQWIAWSRAVADEVETARRARWKKLWIPYSELTEEQKDQDRRWADIALQVIEPLIRQDEREKVVSIIEKEYPAVTAWDFWANLKSTGEKKQPFSVVGAVEK